MSRFLLPTLLLTAGFAEANAANKPAYGKPGERLVLTNDAWRGQPTTPATPAEIDRLIAAELSKLKVTPAPLTTDEQFIRRVTLDVAGKLPTPAEVAAFTADTEPGKRAKLIDKLLASG